MIAYVQLLLFLLVHLLSSSVALLVSRVAPPPPSLPELLTDDSGPSCCPVHGRAPYPWTRISGDCVGPWIGSSTWTGDSIVHLHRALCPCSSPFAPCALPSARRASPPHRQSCCGRCSSTGARGICDLTPDHPQKILTYGHFRGCCPPSSAPTCAAQPFSTRGEGKKGQFKR